MPLLLNLGCCDRHLKGLVNVDRVEPADQIVDLSGPWPWDDDTVDGIFAHDIVEHLVDPIHTMNEAYRVLKPGGWLDIVVPTTEGRGAWQDPTHRSFWNRNTFFYFTDGDPHRERFGDHYGIMARFRVVSEKQSSHPDQVEKLQIRLEAVR